MTHLLLTMLLCTAPLLAGAQSILIAAEDDWAPYSSRKGNSDQPEGLTPQLVREIFASQHVTVKFIAVPFSRCLHMVATGSAVACFNTTITADNRQQFIWHPTPLFHEELAIFALKPAAAHAPVTLKQLAGRLVGITQGYTYPSDFMNAPAIRRVTALSDDNLISMLLARRVDFILLNTMPGYLRANRNPATAGKLYKVGVISRDGFWLNFSRRHPDGAIMAQKFETGLQALKQSGRYQQIMHAFHQRLGANPPPAEPTRQHHDAPR
ncbi:substrate-binding periplasmic protein [Vogesella sp. GCM10023246]|uniref:Transporter substrate-binding domain-containing protein n=1 Tax=Vogesella oryzagri TaxID=3160864 RepID=A0ABV1M2A3_9NEIS